MKIGIPKEIKNNESRVGMTPAGVAEFIRHGHEVMVQHTAGVNSGFADEAYEKVGARILPDIQSVYREAEMIVKVKEPIAEEYPLIHQDQLVFRLMNTGSVQKYDLTLFQCQHRLDTVTGGLGFVGCNGNLLSGQDLAADLRAIQFPEDDAGNVTFGNAGLVKVLANPDHFGDRCVFDEVRNGFHSLFLSCRRAAIIIQRHGGATAEGQLQILKDYGITEEAMDCPVKSSMETVQIGISGVRHQPVFMDKNASEADGIILFNRIKPHTSFRGPYESGLMKMMAIGLGKQKGAESIHHQSPAIMHELVEEYGRTILENAPVLGGIAIIENAYDDTCLIKGLSPEEIITEEPKLKEISYKTIAHLLFDKCDVLVVDKIGKNISGDGMDPNVSGRFVQPKYCSGGIQAEKCVVLDITDETHGNAQGIGLAEVTTRRLVNRMKLEMTYPTGVTNTFLHLMKIPMIMDNDREAIQLALMCCPEAEDHDHMKMIRIPNTAHIGVIEISEGMLPLVENNPNFEVLTEPYDLPFDENGNLF